MAFDFGYLGDAVQKLHRRDEILEGERLVELVALYLPAVEAAYELANLCGAELRLVALTGDTLSFGEIHVGLSTRSAAVQTSNSPFSRISATL